MDAKMAMMAGEQPEAEPEMVDEAPVENDVSAAVDALNSMAKRGLISPQQLASALARLGAADEGAEEAGEAEEEVAEGEALAPKLKAMLPVAQG